MSTARPTSIPNLNPETGLQTISETENSVSKELADAETPSDAEIDRGTYDKVDEGQDAEPGSDMEEQREERAEVSDDTETKPKRTRERKDPPALVREPGKSLLPFSRVQKIIKADKDIPIVAREATFLISLATEEFIKRLSEAAQKGANRENRSTVQHKDIAIVVRKADEFMFLEEIIPWTAVEPPAKRKPKGHGGDANAAPTMLDQFLTTRKEGNVSEESDKEEMGDTVMEDHLVVNEDGLMYNAEIASQDSS